ncbi:hypothetical protein ABEB36_000144 [Hypothenemus hampei]|uniref:Uncharacterized protein n=1 Tax=Hypothenemus hampei TaxID=57062 RepID=A0ABD1FAC7_HYPHA
MDPDIEMASGSEQQSLKRSANVMVDPDDGFTISSAKRARISPDMTKKRSNGIVGNTERKALNKRFYSLTSSGATYTITCEEAIKCCERAATEAGLLFKRFDINDPENWYGIAAPYLDFFVGNMLRLSELRIGHNSMPITRDGDRMRFPVEKYGLNGSHHILLEGCTFPPGKRGINGHSAITYSRVKDRSIRSALQRYTTKGIPIEAWLKSQWKNLRRRLRQ